MASTFRRDTRERLYRARRISSTFARIYLGIKAHQFLDGAPARSNSERRWARFHARSGRQIYDTATELRGLILKGCQFLGARADILPPEYIQALSSLQDRVPPHEFEEIRGQVELELGAPLESVFSFFSEGAIAAASLAQVHQAKLAGGRCVAVKVQYPEIEDLVHFDLANLRALFQAVGLFERDFDLLPLVKELSHHVPLELDFVHEGINAERVAEFFRLRDDIHVPRIHWEITSRRVLVSDFVSGIKISDTDSLDKAGLDRSQIMQSLAEAYCEQIFVHGFFHADPHPGNLLIRPIPGDESRAQIVFLDFGLAKQLPANFRKHVLEFISALVNGDPETMTGALLDLGFETRDDSRKSLNKISSALIRMASRMRHQAHFDPQVIKQA
ncbi:ABC1 kinase family protein, partial [Myxococcota bacterium]|nr:ABC1 kinase family protein [Myxococcota bacterium]